ncbi:unnamed protein product, partial [Discosporangium mesarthrocarpum]
TRTIGVQQDGAKPDARDGVIAASEAAAGANVILETQPSNLPDLNVLDLGFFHSIQRVKDDFGLGLGLGGLVGSTIEAFDDYPLEILEQRCSLPFFAVFGEVLGCKGNDILRIPHPGINKAQRAGRLPQNARVDEEKCCNGKVFLWLRRGGAD